MVCWLACPIRSRPHRRQTSKRISTLIVRIVTNPLGAADTSALHLNIDAPMDRHYGICKSPVAVGSRQRRSTLRHLSGPTRRLDLAIPYGKRGSGHRDARIRSQRYPCRGCGNASRLDRFAARRVLMHETVAAGRGRFTVTFAQGVRPMKSVCNVLLC